MDRIAEFFKDRRLHISIIDILVLCLYVLYVANTFVISEYQCGTVFLHTSLWFCLYFLFRLLGLGTNGRDNNLVVWGCLICGLIESFIVAKQFLGVEMSHHSNYLITGTFPNPGPLGGYIATLAAVVTAGYKKSANVCLGILLVPLVVVLPMTWSRAGILGYGLSVIILYRHELKKYWKWIAMLGFVCTVLLYFLKRGSADGRLFMFIVSFRTFLDNFFLGVGTGGYLHSLGDGIIRYFSENPDSMFIPTVGVADHSFCEPLRIAVEQGVVGAVLVICIVCYAVHKLLKADTPIAYGIITLVFFSCFSYAFSIKPLCILLTIFIAMAGGYTAIKKLRVSMLGLFAIIVPLVAIFTFTSCQLSSRIDAKKNVDRFGLYMDEVFITDYYELLPYIDDNVNVLFNFAEFLRQNGRYNDSNHILNLATNISADPMLHIIMGRNYEDMKCYDLADEKYERAYMMQPNRIYPLYRQMKMYETSNDDRLRDKAQQVYSFSPKVKSAATQEIKQEACQILITIESQIDL